MPLQNRVTPFGEIVSSAARGTLVGNRGCLHDAHRTLSARPGRLSLELKNWSIRSSSTRLLRVGRWSMNNSLKIGSCDFCCVQLRTDARHPTA